GRVKQHADGPVAPLPRARAVARGRREPVRAVEPGCRSGGEPDLQRLYAWYAASRVRKAVTSRRGGLHMKKFMIPLLAVGALALPAAALAHDGWHHHRSLLAKVSGTGSTFGASTASASGSIARSEKLGTGTFSASLTTDWTKA